MIPLRMVFATPEPAKNAPENSKTAAMTTASLKDTAPEPTLVPMALAASLAPILQAI